MRLRCRRSSAAVANLGGCGTFGTVAGGTRVAEPDIFPSVCVETDILPGLRKSGALAGFPCRCCRLLLTNDAELKFRWADFEAIMGFLQLLAVARPVSQA